MAVLDEQTALARIIGRGWLVAQSQELSLSALGPDPALLRSFPQQQLWDAEGMPAASPAPSSTCDWGYTDMTSSPANSTPPFSTAGSATSSPAWAHPDSRGAAAASHKPSSASAARRCLCADLSSNASAAASQTGAAGSPQRDAVSPAVRACPGAPRARTAARVLLPAMTPTATAASGGPLCPHYSPDGRSRLQQWLDHMELQLAVPTSPVVPPTDVPCGPKGHPAAPTAGCKPALSTALAAAATAPAGCSSTGSISSSGTLPAGAAHPTGHQPSQLASSLHSRRRRSSGTGGGKKRSFPSLKVLSTGAVDGAGVSLAPLGNSSGVGVALPVGAGAGVHMAHSSGAVHSSKRRSTDGCCSSIVPLHEGLASDAEGSPPAGSDGHTVLALPDLPVPAFVLLGLLSDSQPLP